MKENLQVYDVLCMMLHLFAVLPKVFITTFAELSLVLHIILQVYFYEK